MIYKKKKMNSARPAAKIRASAVRDVTKTVAVAAFLVPSFLLNGALRIDL
jgi:hypothetical protein